MNDSEKLKNSLIREKHLKLHLDSLVSQSKNLDLILEHAKEYYTDGRLYEFTEGGFVSYELSDTPKGKSIYFADIFVSKDNRGGVALSKIIELCQYIADTNTVNTAYCTIDKTNEYIKMMQHMCHRLGFEEYRQDDYTIYYKWCKP